MRRKLSILVTAACLYSPRKSAQCFKKLSFMVIWHADHLNDVVLRFCADES